MGNKVSQPPTRDLTATVTEICRSTVPADNPVWDGFWHHTSKVEQIFGLIQPDDVRAMRSRLPTNLCMLVIKLIEALERYSGRFAQQDAQPVLNIVRLLTRILPVLLENTEDDFTQRLLWDDQISVLKTAEGTTVSSATAPEQHQSDLVEVWMSVGDFLEQYLIEKTAAHGSGAVASAAASVEDSGTAESPTGGAQPGTTDSGDKPASAALDHSDETAGGKPKTQEASLATVSGRGAAAAAAGTASESEQGAGVEAGKRIAGPRAPLGRRLVHSVMRLLFTAGFTVDALQFAMFKERFLGLKKKHAEEAAATGVGGGTGKKEALGGGGGGEAPADESKRQSPEPQADASGAAMGGGAAEAGKPDGDDKKEAPPPEKSPDAGKRPVTEAESGQPAAATAGRPVIRASTPPFPPTLANSIWPSLLWSGGVVFRKLSPPQSQLWERNRTELLRLLIVCMSQPLYVDTGAGGAARCPLYETAVSPDCPMLPTLFYSLLNTVASFDPEGWGLPYVSAMEADSREPFIDAALQALLLLLDYRPPAEAPLVRDVGEFASAVRAAAGSYSSAGAGGAASTTRAGAAPEPASGAGADVPQQEMDAGENPDKEISAPHFRPLVYNAYRGLMAGIQDKQDFSALFGAVVRFLGNSAKSKQTVLPFSMKALGSHQEALLLLWHMLDSNRAFAQHVVDEEDVCRLVRPLCYFLWRERQSKDWGTVHLICYVLLFLSGYRGFCVQLNKGISTAELPPMVGLPAFDGSHADLLYLTAHKVLVNGSSNHRRMHSLLMLVLSNVSVFVKRVHMVTGTKIASLLTVLGDPSEVLRGPDSVLQLRRLLQMFRNVLQYQYEGHAYLIYAIVKEAAVLHRLETFDVEDVLGPIEESTTEVESADGSAKSKEEGIAGKEGGEEESIGSARGKGGATVVEDGTDGGGGDGVAISEEETGEGEVDIAESGESEDVAQQQLQYRQDLQAWLEEQQAMLPLREIKLALRHLRPRVMRLIEAGGGSVDDEAVLRCIQDDTLVGVLPRPHELVVERYSPTEDTQAWMQRNLWSVVYLRNLDLPFFDVRQIRMFTVRSSE